MRHGVWAVLVLVAGCGGGGAAPDAAADVAVDDPTSANLAVSPSMIDFGSVGAGASSASSTFTISNLGGSAATSLTVTVSNHEFTVAAATCGTALAPGASCTADVKFTPSTTGSKTATLDVAAAGVPARHADLAGSGVTNDDFVTVTPTFWDFGAVVVGQTSSQMFTLTNVGGSPHMVNAFLFSGSGAAEVSVAQDMCSGTQLPPSGSCTIHVVFAPTSPGLMTASTTTMPAISSFGVAGSGASLASALVMSPTLSVFGNVTIGTTSSAASTYTIQNTGATTTAALATTRLGADAAQFTISADTCTGATLAQNATCTVGVKFSPTTTGDKMLTLQVTDGAGATAQSYAQGSGV